MTQTDYLKRLEDKVNRAIEHIEQLTVENERLQTENQNIAEKLHDYRRELNQVHLDERTRASQVRDKIRSILRKVDSLNSL
ncbi:cell division protein ZapB [bacterium AH-315-J21]|nr:cell division protein ZapB [bacterium AH-315-J21]